MFDHLVYRRTGFNHHHDDTRTLYGIRQFFDRMCSDEVLPFTAAIHKTIHHTFLTGKVTVIYSNGKTFAFHIQSQVLAHYGKPDQSDICFFHVLSILYFVFIVLSMRTNRSAIRSSTGEYKYYPAKMYNLFLPVSPATRG